MNEEDGSLMETILLSLLVIPFVIGLASGLGSGFFGIGGGSIRIPLLNLIGYPLIVSYGINMFTIPVSCSIGAYTQRENVDIRLGKYMVAGGIIGTIIGTAIVFLLSASALVLAVFFVIASILTVIGMNLKYITSNISQKLFPSPYVIGGGALAANTLGGMKGGSGGSLFGPLLKSFNVEIHRAIATSLFSVIFTSLVGVILYWSNGQILIVEGVAVLVGSIIGTRLGSKRSLKTKSRSLEIGLSIVVIVLASITLLKALIV
ncbi:MAG: sulfite exporter TauE/SafE family protein [Candidatus Thorarchaeota archaeon]